MAKYKRYDYSQSVLIPVSLGEQLVPGTLEFAIDALVERRMDMSRSLMLTIKTMRPAEAPMIPRFC